MPKGGLKYTIKRYECLPVVFHVFTLSLLPSEVLTCLESYCSNEIIESSSSGAVCVVVYAKIV